jgi:hypothetical protein
LAAFTTILPPKDLQVDVVKHPPALIRAPVGFAARLTEEEFWNWFWFIHSTAVNVS